VRAMVTEANRKRAGAERAASFAFVESIGVVYRIRNRALRLGEIVCRGRKK
jgi:hypothetical protein